MLRASDSGIVMSMSLFRQGVQQTLILSRYARPVKVLQVDRVALTFADKVGVLSSPSNRSHIHHNRRIPRRKLRGSKDPDTMVLRY